MRKARLKNVTMTLNTEETAKALKLAQVENPEANLSALVRELLRRFIAKGEKL